MFKQPNISLFTIVQFFIGTIFVLNTYISVTKRCVQILSSALSIVCVIDCFFYADKSVSWCWRFSFNIIHLINTGTLFKNLTFSENVQKILGKKSFPLTPEYTLKVSEQWQLFYWDLYVVLLIEVFVKLRFWSKQFTLAKKNLSYDCVDPGFLRPRALLTSSVTGVRIILNFCIQYSIII